MIRIYLAAASSQVARAERWRDALRSTEKFVVTHDWMAQVRAAQAAGHVTDATLAIDERVVHAKNDWDAVHTADVVWLLLPSPGKFSTGCWVELGMALERQRLVLPRSTIVLSGENLHACLFTALVPRHYVRDEDAFAWLSTGVREPLDGAPLKGSLLDFDGVPRTELERRIRGLAQGAYATRIADEDEEESRVCEDCGGPVDCQGSDPRHRYHHDNPRHRVAMLLGEMSRDALETLMRDVDAYHKNVR